MVGKLEHYRTDGLYIIVGCGFIICIGILIYIVVVGNIIEEGPINLSLLYRIVKLFVFIDEEDSTSADKKKQV